MDREQQSPPHGLPGGEPHPTHLGQYVVERELGRGGMGVVYLARDPRLDRLVAIKVLPETLERDKDRLGRFEREARVLASLNHTNIASIYSVDQTPSGARLLVLEYVEGQNLADLLLRAPMTVKEALRICAQIARAIVAAHGKGIIHRDIKPGNVMVTRDGHVKVLDFGLSTRETNPDTAGVTEFQTASLATMPGRVMGTAGYMSPEQARGKPVDKRTDIWAFGCILYKCLSGQHVFAGETTTDVIVATLSTDPDWERLPPTTPERVRRLLAKCLEKAPDDRIEDISIALAEVEEAIVEFDKGGGLVNARFGEYQVVEELHRGATATVCLVRPARSSSRGESSDEGGDAALSVAKIIEPSPMILGADQATAKCRDFLQGVTVQKRAAANDPQHWAPVIASGRASTAAYWVTEQFDRSAAEFARFRESLGALELRNVIGNVVAGLRELKQTLNRPHGNVKPTNVLIAEDEGPEGLAAARVVLSDPLSDAQIQAQGRTERDDLRDVGRLIHLLVLHKEWNGEGGAVPYGPEWNRLGRHGRTWHGLCVKLLGPEDDAITLDELSRSVERIRSFRFPMRAASYGAAAVLALVLVGGGIAALMSRPDTPQAVTPPVLSPEPPHEPPLAPPPETVDRPWWAGALCAQTELSWLEALLPEASLGALAGDPDHQSECEEQVHVLIAAWLDAVHARAATLRERGLDHIARGVRTAIARTESTLRLDPPDSDIAADLATDAVREIAALETRFAAWEQQLDELEQQAAELVRVARSTAPASRAGSRAAELQDDRFIVAFRDIAWRTIDAAPDIESVDAAIRSTRAAARQLLELIERHWPEIDHAWLRNKPDGLYQQLDALEGSMFAVYGRWEAEIRKEEYRLLPVEQNPIDGVAAIGIELQETLQRYDEECDEPLPNFTVLEYDDVLKMIESVQAREWDRTRSGTAQLNNEIDRLKTRCEQLQAALPDCSGECDKLLVALLDKEPPWPASAAAVQVAWERGLEAMQSDEGAECRQRYDNLSGLQQFLRECNAAFAPVGVPANWHADAARREAVAALARARHEALLQPLLDGITFESLLDPTVRQERHEIEESYKSWRDAAERLLNELATIEERLNECFGLEEAAPGQETMRQLRARWEAEPAFAELRPLASGIVERVEALEALPADRNRLLAVAIDTSARNELRFAAWRRLGEVETTHPDVLEHELSAAAAIRNDVLRDVSAGRAQSLGREIDQQLVRRWRDQANSSPEGLARAADVQERFGVSEDDLQSSLQFSLRLLRLRQHLALHQEDEDALRDAALSFRDWLEGPKDDLGENVRTLHEQLGEILVDEAPGTDWANIGPGRLGWIYEPDEDEDIVFYRRPASEEWKQSRSLTFRRVSAEDAADARYLCTVELPVGVFIDTVAASVRRGQLTWSDLHALLEGTYTAGEDTRRGVRVWQRTEPHNDNSSILPSDAWFAQLRPSDFDPGIRSLFERPTVDHPMQQISTGAAMLVAEMLGCELPTKADWMAAYELNPSQARRQVNLRDASWLAQDAFFRKAQPHEMPRRGVHREFFAPESHSVSTSIWTTEHGFSLANRLFFHAVAEGEDEQIRDFRDLIGNVAEFVLKERGGEEVLVIGASALSPASMHVESADGDVEWAVPLLEVGRIRARQTFSDVGMRLALDAGDVRETFLARLKRELDKIDYLLTSAR